MASWSKESHASCTMSGFAWVSGRRGMNSVQQSAASCADMSYVPISCARRMISCLSEPMSGRSTGMLTISFTTEMFSSVCDATWPSDSPVTSAFAPSKRAMRSATANITLRYVMMRRLCGTHSDISRCFCPNGTTYRRPTMPDGAIALMMSWHRYSLVSAVIGRPEKCTGTHTAPRRPTIHVATGESKPLDRSVTTLPAVPTGRPPTPTPVSVYTYTLAFTTITMTVTSGWCISTFLSGNFSHRTLPTRRLMSSV